jgi:hypothetical protein
MSNTQTAATAEGIMITEDQWPTGKHRYPTPVQLALRLPDGLPGGRNARRILVSPP